MICLLFVFAWSLPVVCFCRVREVDRLFFFFLPRTAFAICSNRMWPYQVLEERRACSDVVLADHVVAFEYVYDVSTVSHAATNRSATRTILSIGVVVGIA